MGSTPEYLILRLPRTGAVAPNSAIVLEGYVLDGNAVAVTAMIDDAEIAVTVEAARWFSYDRFPSRGTFYLVRPVADEWPHGATVLLTCQKPFKRLEVPIGRARDLAAPGFESLCAPIPRTLSQSHGATDVIALDHGVFHDPASPIVLLTIELGTTTLTGVVPEGNAGTLALEPSDDVGHVHSITLSDVAGHTHRIVRPCGPPPPPVAVVAPVESRAAFTCVAGTLASVDGAPDAFVATTDGGNANGFSRGHYLTTQTFDGDVEIAVSAVRLTGEHEMPIEIAFRGGFFGVTGASSWYLYEHDGHWSGWKPTPSTVGPGPLTLRVIQRGQQVTGYVNDELAGRFVLEKPVVAAPVGIHFKGHPQKEARIRFHQFIARAVAVN